jgi:hypothetical protein
MLKFKIEAGTPRSPGLFDKDTCALVIASSFDT